MKKFCAVIFLSCFAAYVASAVPAGRTKLDYDWRFSLEADSSAIRPDYDDSAWRAVSLPHDWSVEHDFDSICPSGNDGGYLPTGTGWYRRTLTVPEIGDRHRSLYIEGAYMNSEVWVNGHHAGGHPYGYTSYRVDITPFLHTGDNTIAVKVDNSRQKNSRWYSGSGLYRHVWLEEYAPVHIEPWSLRITTPAVRPGMAVARVEYTVADSDKSRAAAVSFSSKILITAPDGTVLPPVTETFTLRPSEKARMFSADIPVPDPQLWSPDSPELYSLSLVLCDDAGNVTGADNETFGIRSFDYWADEGFTLNEAPLLITGACVHHDNGILGAASYDDAEYRKVRLLKDAGFNAVRTSHNPPSPAFLDACDRIGLLVIDESFDGWREAKNTHDYSELFDEWWDTDIESMVKRDRNHPSIICWSIGNEIIERKSPEAVTTAHDLASLCRRLDPTRPVTSALAAWDPDWEIYDPLAAEHDIVGYNYMIHKSESDHQRVPDRVMWQTESYPRDAFANWVKVKDYPYIIGDFVWTGIDYIGESGIGRYYYEGDPEGEHFHRPLWPWHNSYCGDIDIIGNRKPISYYREMLYSKTPEISLAVREPDGYHGKIKETMWGTAPTWASWNWPGHEGKPVTVEVASTYPQVALYINDRLIGKKTTNRAHRFMAEFEIPYTPGTLKAVALDKAGRPKETKTLVTTGRPAAIRLTADRTEMPASKQSLVYVTAEIVDADGNVVTDATDVITFDMEGLGTILATGSADPKDPDGYTKISRRVWNGRALAVAAGSDDTGEMVVIATAPGLAGDTVTVKSVK